MDPLNPSVNSFIEQSRAVFLQATGDPSTGDLMAWQALANLRQQQSRFFGVLRYFWLAAMLARALLARALLFLLRFMKRSVAEKGAHIAAE